MYGNKNDEIFERVSMGVDKKPKQKLRYKKF